MRVTTLSRAHLLDVYDCWLHVATDRRQVAQLRRKHGKAKVPPQDSGEFGSTLRFREQPADRPEINHWIIYVDVAAHRSNQGALLNTIAHEAAHAAAGILDSTGTEYDGNSEPLAWLVGWLVEWVWTSVSP